MLRAFHKVRKVIEYPAPLSFQIRIFIKIIVKSVQFQKTDSQFIAIKYFVRFTLPHLVPEKDLPLRDPLLVWHPIAGDTKNKYWSYSVLDISG